MATKKAKVKKNLDWDQGFLNGFVWAKKHAYKEARAALDKYYARFEPKRPAKLKTAREQTY